MRFRAHRDAGRRRPLATAPPLCPGVRRGESNRLPSTLHRNLPYELRRQLDRLHRRRLHLLAGAAEEVGGEAAGVAAFAADEGHVVAVGELVGGLAAGGEGGELGLEGGGVAGGGELAQAVVPRRPLVQRPLLLLVCRRPCRPRRSSSPCGTAPPRGSRPARASSCTAGTGRSRGGHHDGGHDQPAEHERR